MNHDSPLASRGVELVPAVLAADETAAWRERLGAVSSAGRRRLLAEPEVAAFAASARLLALVRPHLNDEPRAVRAIFFDKTPDANWLVPWHQDLTLAVRERADVPGFGPWSVKDGVPHVQPPAEWLARMVTLRLHLDDAGASNGALRVIPGSHRHGRLAPGEVSALRQAGSEVTCEARAGDGLLMRPLLLHASARSASPAHRRVLHIEYAGFSLPPPLAWHEAA